MKNKFKLLLRSISSKPKLADTPPKTSNEVSFLHIGKNAGTQVMHVARQLNEYGVNVKNFGHEVKLSELPSDSKYFFSIRKPETRFFSGFYSRKRKGQPKIFKDWTLHEKLAFNYFEDANDLAENLFAEGIQGKNARQAIKSIYHTGMQQFDWFQRCAFFDQQPPLTIIRQENFVSDMQRLLTLLNVDVDVTKLLTNDKVAAHSNDYSSIPPLSDLALKNLTQWYIQDYYFYQMCSDWLEDDNR